MVRIVAAALIVYGNCINIFDGSAISDSGNSRLHISSSNSSNRSNNSNFRNTSNNNISSISKHSNISNTSTSTSFSCFLHLFGLRIFEQEFVL